MQVNTNLFQDIAEYTNDFAFLKLTFNNGSINFNLKCEDDEDQLALAEIRLAKQFAMAEKKKLQALKKEFTMARRAQVASKGPKMIGGGKLGSVVRAFQTISRAGDRVDHTNRINNVDSVMQQVDIVLLQFDKLTAHVKAGIVRRARGG